MNFKEAYNALNSEQRQAVDQIDGPVLIIAGPGTGKTQLLAVRVANILRQTDTNPENILCLTFTETGARNMRDRLTSFIGNEANKINISTYHTFGSLLLKTYQNDPLSSIDELEQFTIIRQIQASLNPNDILKGDYHTKNIISAISDLKTALLKPEDLRQIVAKNSHDNQAISKALQPLFKKLPPRGRFNVVAPIYGEMMTAIAPFTSSTPIVGKVEPIANVYLSTLNEILNQEYAKDKPSASPLTAWRNKYFDKDADDQFRINDYVANKKLLSLANIMEQYDQYLADHQQFDYDDMILSAIKILEDNPDFKYTTQERYQYILLDEFQDTNDAQAHLVQLLTDNPANNGQPNIMAVGDDDQAIYGFQGARQSNFQDFNDQYHPKIITLTKNYRSSQPILNLAQNVISQTLDRFSASRGINKIISAQKQIPNSKIHRQEFSTALAEYSWVAQQIRQLIDNGEKASNIALIAPKHKYLESILAYLKNLDIPISYQKRENILEDESIISLTNHMRLLLALADKPQKADPYWFQLLSLKCWEIPPQELISLIQKAAHARTSILEQLLNSTDEKYQTIANFNLNLAAKAANFSAEYIINAIICKCYNDCDNYDLLTNLIILRDLAREKSATQKLLLQDFINLIDAYTAAEIPILNKSPYHESDNSVQLLTVHSAKGLEFEHVFLIATDDQNWGNAKGNTDQIALPYNLEFARHTGDSADEKLRVFFVAITRAKTNLYLTSSLSNFLGKVSPHLKFLDEREVQNENNATRALTSFVIPEPFNTVIQNQPETISSTTLALDLFGRFNPNNNPDLKQQLAPTLKAYRLSPTHLNDYIDLEYAGPEQFVKRHLYKIPEESSLNLNYGTIIHEIMQSLNDQKLPDTALLELFIDKVNNADADDSEKTELIARGKSQLQTYLASRGNYLRNTEAIAEKAFYNENIFLPNPQNPQELIPITGKIDRIEINHDTKTISVVDFKTSKPKNKLSDSSCLKYRLQLYFYKFILENSREFRDFKIIEGRIEFIRPDDYDEILYPRIDFDDPKKDLQIRQLISSVYSNIINLNLPDLSAFKTSNNPTQAFIEYLISQNATQS